MDDTRPRFQSVVSFDPAPLTRAILVRYFAWGYLSRRELNERLRALEPQEQSAAA